MSIHDLYKKKEIKIWVVQKWVKDDKFSGKWEWVEDSINKEQSVRDARTLTKLTKISHRSNYRTELKSI